MDEKLKPCPFCGAEAEIRSHYDGSPGFLVRCLGCGVSKWLGEGWGVSALAELWDRRTPGPATAKMVIQTKLAVNDIEQHGRAGVSVLVDPTVARAFIAEDEGQGVQP